MKEPKMVEEFKATVIIVMCSVAFAFYIVGSLIAGGVL